MLVKLSRYRQNRTLHHQSRYRQNRTLHHLSRHRHGRTLHRRRTTTISLRQSLVQVATNGLIGKTGKITRTVKDRKGRRNCLLHWDSREHLWRDCQSQPNGIAFRDLPTTLVRLWAHLGVALTKPRLMMRTPMTGAHQVQAPIQPLTVPDPDRDSHPNHLVLVHPWRT